MRAPKAAQLDGVLSFARRSPARVSKQRSPARTAKRLEPLLTVAEVAEILNASAKTVRRAIAADELRAIKIGGILRIDPVDLEDFVRDHRSR
jgi:excisionase family DNA binding protein